MSSKKDGGSEFSLIWFSKPAPKEENTKTWGTKPMLARKKFFSLTLNNTGNTFWIWIGMPPIMRNKKITKNSFDFIFSSRNLNLFVNFSLIK